MNLADRMVQIYAEGREACFMGEDRSRNPYSMACAESYCWLHGRGDEEYEIDSAIEQLREDDSAYGAVIDGRGRVLAECWPADDAAPAPATFL